MDQKKVECRRMRFEPGDCILVEVMQPITKKQEKAIRTAVEKWSGGKNEVLVVNLNAIRIRKTSGTSLPTS